MPHTSNIDDHKQPNDMHTQALAAENERNRKEAEDLRARLAEAQEDQRRGREARVQEERGSHGASVRPIWSQSGQGGQMFGERLTDFQRTMLQNRILNKFADTPTFGGDRINRQQNMAFDYWQQGRPLRTMPWGPGQAFQNPNERRKYGGTSDFGVHRDAPWERIMQQWSPQAVHRYNEGSWNFENQWQNRPPGFMADPARRPGANLPFSQYWNPYMRMDTSADNPLILGGYGI